MPTIITHALLPLTAGLAAGPHRVSRQLMVAGAVAAMLPDADVVSFWLGIPYASDFGHRGATHSVVFAASLGLLAVLGRRSLRAPGWLAGLFVGASALSHPLLDAMTNGGRGVALAWPFEPDRFFFSWRPIEVSPIGARFFSTAGLHTLVSEMAWVWLPCVLLGALAWAVGRAKRR